MPPKYIEGGMIMNPTKKALTAKEVTEVYPALTRRSIGQLEEPKGRPSIF